MKNQTPLTLLFGLIIILFSSFSDTYTNPIKLKVEPNHSTILFSVPIGGGLTRVVGKFKDYEIEMDHQPSDPSLSSIRVLIQVASIDTGIADRDAHLLTPDFFDLASYPEIRFESSSIEVTDESYLVRGMLDFHGIQKEITIPMQPTGQDGDYTFGFKSRFKLNRSDYKLASEFKHTNMDNFIGDTVEIEIDFWTRKRKEQE